jgi:hypothetical protein
MASFLNVDLPSEDEEDDDFVPNEIDEDERAAKGKKKTKRLRGAGHDTDASDDSPEAEEDIIPESKRAEKKAKVNELWSQMNKGGGAPTSNVPKPAGNINLAALCRKPAATKKPKNGDDSWKRQLGLLGTNNSKKRVVTSSTISSVTSDAELEKKKGMAAAAINAAKDATAATDAAQRGMVMITETRRFAGQNIEVNREVVAGSKIAQKAEAEEAAAAGTTHPKPSSSGLDAVLASLGQVKKVTVLDKTRADWKDLKRTDAELKEELESHKRSGTTYLEKQAFLKQAELAEYERERDARLGADVRNRGFLG